MKLEDYDFDDDEIILYSKVFEYKQPVKNLIGIYTKKDISSRETYDLKNFNIIPIPQWIKENFNLDLAQLFDKIIEENLIIFSNRDSLKNTLAYFYLDIHKQHKEPSELDKEIKHFLKDNELFDQSNLDRKELQKDLEKYDKLSVIKEKFLQLEPLVSSKIEFDKIRYIAEVQWKKRRLTTEDFQEFFETFKCTKDLIYVTGEDKFGLPWSKFYLDLEKTTNKDKREYIDKINFMKKRIFKDYKKRIRELESKDVLVYLIFSENLESFGLINFDKSIIMIETIYGSNIFDIISKSSPYLNFIERNIIILNISGAFNIYNIDLYPEVFLDMILNDEFLNLHIVFDESLQPTYKKKKTFYHFKLPLVSERNIETLSESEEGEYIYSFEKTVLFFISQEFIPAMKVYDYKGNLIDLRRESSSEREIPYLKVHFFRSLSESFMIQFFHKINRLFQYYNLKKDEYIKNFEEILDDENSINYLKKSRKNKIKIFKNLNILQNYDPELFIRKYARKCQKSRQPVIINENEIPEFRKDFQILGYPLVNSRPKWYFVCKDNKYKFPGLKENTLQNKDKFPYLPCCFENDQKDNIDYRNAILISGSNIFNITNSPTDLPTPEKLEPEERSEITLENLRKITKFHKIISDKVIPPIRLAELKSDVISYILPNIQVFRLGVPLSPNSVLHAIYISLKSEEYFNAKDKELFVQHTRKKIAHTVNPEVCKQELYDYSEEEIQEMIEKYDIFDTKYFIRAIEEYFDINLLVLTYYPTHLYEKSKLSNYLLTLTTSSSVKLYSFEIPRHRIFHTRRFKNNRKIILIFKHMGTEADGLKYPHYELVVRQSTKQNIQLHFDPEEGTSERDLMRRLFEIFFSNFTVFRWNIRNYSLFPPVSYDAFFSKIQPMIQYQIIDKIGKVRGFILKDDITLLIPPTATENIKSTNILRRVHYKKVLDFIQEYKNFIEIAGISIENKKLVGIWLDEYYDGIYIPVKIDEIPEELQKYKIYPELPCREFEENIFMKFEEYKRIITCFLQTISHKIRLGDIEKVIVDEKLNIEQFEDILLKLKNKINQRTFYIKEIIEVLVQNEIIKGKVLRVPTDHIRKSIIYASNMYDLLSIRVRSEYVKNVYKEPEYDKILTSWNIFPHEMKKQFMTRWLDLPNKNRLRNVLSIREKEYTNVIYKVIDKNIFYDIKMSVVSISNVFFIAYKPDDMSKESSIITSKYWKENRKIIEYIPLDDEKEIVEKIEEEDGIKEYEVLDSGEISLKKVKNNIKGEADIFILGMEIYIIEEKTRRKRKIIYFSLLPVSPIKPIEERVFKIPTYEEGIIENLEEIKKKLF